MGKQNIFVLGLFLPLITMLLVAMPARGTDAKPPYVVNESTAIGIAKGVLIPLLGDKPVENAGKWWATGSAQIGWIVENAPPSRWRWTNQVIRVEIESDSRVSFVDTPSHTLGVHDYWLVMHPRNKAVTPVFGKQKFGHITAVTWHGMGLSENPKIRDLSTTGFCPDASTSIAIAKAALSPRVGGDQKVACPFDARLVGTSWHVESKGNPTMKVEIDRQSARILKVSY